MSTTPESDAPDAGTQAALLDSLRAAAQAGSGSASCRLGDLYREGQAVEQDWDEAFRWYRLGASQGDAHAQNNLGTMFLRGAGCLPDEAQAVFWYRKSAEQGHMTGQSNLAKRYLRGEGVASDLAEAFRWFHAAGMQGDLASACEVGTMFQFGRGVPRNLLAAAGFHLLAAKGGVVAAVVSLGDYRDELQDIALSGNQVASRFLCEMHNDGLGVEESQPLTWTWIKWAKEQCKPADEPGEVAEVEETYEFYEQWLSEEVRAEGEPVLASLLQPCPRTFAGRAPRLLTGPRGKAGSGGGKESA